MISFKGRLSFIPQKAQQMGHESLGTSGCQQWLHVVWKLYCGKEGDDVERGLAHRVVMDLVGDDRLGLHTYLSQTTFTQAQPCFVTIVEGVWILWDGKERPLGDPPTVGNCAQKREVLGSRNNGILALKRKDKQDVIMLSTFHSREMTTTTRRSRRAIGGVGKVLKPQVVQDYNLHMGGVDKSMYIHYIHLSYKVQNALPQVFLNRLGPTFYQ